MTMRPRTIPFLTFIVCALVVLLPVSAALAHAERQSSDPKEGKKLDEPPLHLYINFSEPPTGDSQVTVTDGCGNDVIDNFDVQDRTIHANLLAGQPGEYNVTTQVVSGLDGHETNDAWSFTVTGTKDCSAAPPTSDSDGAGTSAEEDDGIGSVALLAAGGAVVLIGIAAAIRLRSR
jgi:methionine-rich copper-binding protein CopC